MLRVGSGMESAVSCLSQEEQKPPWPAQHHIATGLRIDLGLLLPTHPQALLHPSMSARGAGLPAEPPLMHGR